MSLYKIMQMELMMWVSNSLLILLMYSLSDSTQLLKEFMESQELLLVLGFPFILLQTYNLMLLPSSGTTLNEGNCTSLMLPWCPLRCLCWYIGHMEIAVEIHWSGSYLHLFFCLVLSCIKFLLDMSIKVGGLPAGTLFDVTVHYGGEVCVCLRAD